VDLNASAHSVLPPMPLPGHWSTCACVCVCVRAWCVRVQVCACVCVRVRVRARACVRVSVCELAHTYQPSAIRPLYSPTRHQVGVSSRSPPGLCTQLCVGHAGQACAPAAILRWDWGGEPARCPAPTQASLLRPALRNTHSRTCTRTHTHLHQASLLVP